MKAITFSCHGNSEVLEYSTVPTPRPGSGEVLVAVRAVSVNRGPDIETRRRGFAMGSVVMPHIGGVDPAGEIAELGPDVEGFAVGQRVAVYPVIACGKCEFCLAGASENMCSNSRLFGVQTPGGRAEYVVVPATQLVALSDETTYEAAAALGVAYTTTRYGLVQRARITSADTLLVTGAGGATGVAAVQIAKQIGAQVIAVTGEQWKQERLAALGADVVLNYHDDDWPDQAREATAGRGVSIAFDNAGTATLAKSISCLARAGTLVCCGGTSGLDVALNVRQLYRSHISLLFYVQGAKADLEALVALVAAGDLEPVIDRTYSLSDAAAADDHLDSPEHFGRVVLRVDPSPLNTEPGLGTHRLIVSQP